MQSTVAHDAETESVFASVGQAARDAAANASADAAKVKQAMDDAAPKVMKSLSNMAYSTAYVCAFGVVYASVFTVRLLPTDNAVMRGFKAGTQAALDELDKS
jgi:hypothetical protein